MSKATALTTAMHCLYTEVESAVYDIRRCGRADGITVSFITLVGNQEQVDKQWSGMWKNLDSRGDHVHVWVRPGYDVAWLPELGDKLSVTEVSKDGTYTHKSGTHPSWVNDMQRDHTALWNEFRYPRWD